MAKHDQRIQKFLNQNADRAPTITEMMTRLNISISDISDSLNSLLAQGLIAKRTNSQGIECWFPAGAQTAAQAAPAQQFAAPSHLQAPQLNAAQMVGEIRSSPEARPMDSRYAGAVGERPMPLPEAQPPAPKPAPVHVQHVSMGDRSATQTQSFAVPAGSQNPQEAFPSPANSSPAAYGFQQPSSKGIGFLTFVVGLIAAVGFSTWLAGRLATNEIHSAAKTFVDQKALNDANAAFSDFQSKTKTHIASLEDQVKKLSDQLTASRAAAESLKVAAVAPAKAVVSKTEDAPAKTKAGKKTQVAKATKSSPALAKAMAAPRVKKKKPNVAHSAPKPESSSSDGASTTAASYSDPSSSPSVPQPPGLDNQELPPPPSE